MAHYPIEHNDTPIRLFKADFLEFFSHISPVTIVVIWMPVVVFFLVRAYWVRPAFISAWYILPGYVLGLFIWTLAEYLLHRFIFHFKARNPWQERVIFLFHGVHHAQPQCKTRLVMPPVVSIPLALVLYGLFYLVIGMLMQNVHWVAPIFAGMITGYIIYDLTHYATHNFPMRSKVLKFLKRYHMQHHYKTPNMRFGVSSPLWDIVFKTKPAE